MLYFLYFICELISIIAYLFNGKIGMLVTAIIFTYIFFQKKYSVLDKILVSLLFSLPLFNIGIAGRDMNHIFSWSTIFLILLLFYMINFMVMRNIKLKKKSFAVIVMLLSTTLLHCFFEVNMFDSLIEWCQLILMIIPIFLIYSAKNYVKKYVNLNEEYLSILNSVLMATSISVIIQSVLYYKFGILVGEWTFFQGRTKIDLLFTGSSVLSMFLGIAIPLNLVMFFDKKDIKYLIYIFIAIMGIMINSARTGLVAGLLVSIPLVISRLKYKKNILIMFLLMPVVVLSLIYGTNYMLEKRGSTNLIEENGRKQTYINAIDSISNSPYTFFFGNGLSLGNYNQMMPHNLFLETWLTMGIFNLFLVISMLFTFFKLINNYKYKYLAWEIIVGGMFITNFTGNTFATVIFMLLIIQSEREKSERYE